MTDLSGPYAKAPRARFASLIIETLISDRVYAALRNILANPTARTGSRCCRMLRHPLIISFLLL